MSNIKPTYEELEKRILELELKLQIQNSDKDKDIAELKNKIGTTAGEIVNEQSYDLLKYITDNIPGNIAIVDAETLKYKFVNKIFCKSYNKSEEELIGLTVEELVGQSNFEYALEYINKVRTGKETSYINTFNLSSGKRYIQVSLRPRFDSSGKVEDILVTGYDISELKQVEQELNEKNELITLFIKNSPIHAYIKNVTQTESKVLYASENFIDLIGIKSSNMVGKNMYDLFPEEFAKKITADDWKVVSEGKILIIFEDFNNRNYTTYKYPITVGDKNLLAGYTVEITELKQIENKLTKQNLILDKEVEKRTKELKEHNLAFEHVNKQLAQINNDLVKAKEKAEKSEEKYRLLAENSNDVVWLLDLNLNFIYISPSAEKLFGYTIEERKEIPIEKLYNAETMTKLKNIISNKKDIFYKTGVNQSHTFELEGIHKNGQPVYFEISAKFVLDNNNHIKCIQGTSRDISERVLEVKHNNYLLELYKKSDKSETTKLTEISLNAAVELTNSKIGFMHLINSDNETISLHTWSTNTLKICNNATKEKHYPISKAGVWVDCLKTKKPLVHNNYQNLEHKKGLPENHIPLVREITIPIFEGDKIVAIMGVGNKETDYTDRDVLLLNNFAINFWNIIRRKTTESENRKLQKAVENSRACIVITNIEGNIEYANPAFTDISGYSPEEYLGKNPRLLKTELHDKEYYTNLWERIKSGMTWEGEFQNKNKNGEIYWEYTVISPIFSAENEITHFVAIKSNITESKRMTSELLIAKEKAEISEYKVRSMFDNSHTGFIYFNTEGYIIEVNKAVLDIIGSPSFELTKKINLLTFKPLVDVGFSQDVLNCIEQKKGIENSAAYTSKWGKTIYMKYFLIPIMLEEKIIGIWANLQDLTDLWNTQKDLISAKEKAEESNQLKSSFLQNMSHEIRTPLNAIVGFSQLLTTPNQVPEKIKRYSDLITTSSQKLIQIITDVIEISQIQSNQINVNYSQFDIISLIDNIFASFSKISQEKNIEMILTKKISAEKYHIYSDIEKIEKTLTHLIDNALKFTSQGFVEIICEWESEKLKISVIDSGIGISEEMQEVIFEPFRQVENGMTRNFGGNGLGLSIAKAYIELLNGSITLKSVVNQGSTFIFTIPVNKENTSMNLKVKNEAENTIKTILIVEDEYSNYQYLLALLEDLNLEIIYADNGKKAIDLCRKNSNIDLILMDIKMPVMDGQTAAKLIKAFKPNLPIIAQTAFALETERIAFINDFDDFITKPISQDELMQKLSRYIEK